MKKYILLLPIVICLFSCSKDNDSNIIFSNNDLGK